MKTMQKGFTLIELMVVIAIVGILAVVAVPLYKSHTARAQMSEALSLAEGQKHLVVEYFVEHGAFPSDNLSGTVEGKYVASVVTGENGVITATMKDDGVSADIQSAKLKLTPEDKGGSIAWSCSAEAGEGRQSADLDGYLPAACKSAAKPAQ